MLIVVTLSQYYVINPALFPQSNSITVTAINLSKKAIINVVTVLNLSSVSNLFICYGTKAANPHLIQPNQLNTNK